MPRPHKSSIVVGTVVGIMLVLIMVPGRIVDGLPYSQMTLEHGWPFNYLRRQAQGRAPAPPYFIRYPSRQSYVAERPTLGIPWLSADNWRFWEANVEDGTYRWDFNVSLLFIDIVAASLVLVAAVTVWELRRRRRPSVFAFRIADMLVAVASLSALLGWLVYQQREFQREERIIESEDERKWGGNITDYWNPGDEVCIAPVFMRSLIVERLMPAFLWRTCEIEIHPEENGMRLDTICEEISKLVYLTKITIWADSEHRFPFSVLRRVERFNTLDIIWYGEIDEQDIGELAQLTQLKKIEIDFEDEIPANVLNRLKAELPEQDRRLGR